MKELFVIGSAVHGRGQVIFKWDPTCKYLASCGANRRVQVRDRNGEIVTEFPLSGPRPCIAMDWDKDGENLAVLQDSSPIVPIWNVNDGKVKPLETNLKDPSFLCWSRVGPQLAVGSQKGNLLIYNNITFKKVPMMGKHTKKITCGAWNLENKLALASQDRMMTISNENGDLLEQAHLKHDPFDIQFAEQKVDEKQITKENTVSINMGHLTILMYNMTDTENPVELAFQPKYGDIAAYKWFGDGYMMVGFSRGWVIAISTHMKEIGEELQSLKVHEGQLFDLCYSPQLNKLATCGDDGVRVVDMTDFKESKSEHREFKKEDGDPEKLEWTRDGQILTVATNGGCLYNFLMSIPSLATGHGAKLAYLSSLRGVTIIDAAVEGAPLTVDIAVEPSFIALGANQVAVGMNNHCWFYSLDRARPGLVAEREYVGTVKQIFLNDQYCVVLCDGKAHLHLIVPNPNLPEDREHKIFPDKDETIVTSVGLTNDFLIFSTSRGTLHHFYLADWAFANECKTDSPILAVFPNHTGTRSIFIDNSQRAWLHSPVDDSKIAVPNWPASIENVLWDPCDPSLFVAVDAKINRQLITYTYTAQTIRGPAVTKICPTKTQANFSSILLYDGNVHGQKATGQIGVLTLASHEAINFKGRKLADKLRQALQQLQALGRLKTAWELAMQVKSKDVWLGLARKAMEQLDLELAIRVYRELRDTAMVMALQDIIHIEDRHLLSGQIHLLFGEYDKAERLFVNSTIPITALQMRRDLLHWDKALSLATNLAPDQIPSICREYAQQLEVKGEYQDALRMYQRSLEDMKVETKSESKAKRAPAKFGTVGNDDHIRMANGGIARMTLRLGDLAKGRALALDSNDKMLIKECAAILEQMKQLNDAAELYVRAEQYEKGVSIYILTRNFRLAAPLMDRITTPKLHHQYAKAKEAEKAYSEAAIAYEKAKDMDSVVRLNLNFLDNPTKAFAIVRNTRSAEGAGMIARYSVSAGNYQSAIEFLLMAKRNEEAFQLAQAHREMEHYARSLGDDGTTEEYLKIAAHYEEAKDPGRAGTYYAFCRDFTRAIKLFLQCGEARIDDAINVVKKAEGLPERDTLSRLVQDFLLGEIDGKIKDPKFSYKLFMAVGDYIQAATTAISIASAEQKDGQYQNAHDILFSMHQDLVARKLPVPSELRRNLLLLHSYILVKTLTKKADHKAAARLLIRVSQSISKFPAHVVPILTSTVIECQRAGLKRSSWEYSSMLMRPEYRKDVNATYRKKIETIVRRPQQAEEEESLSPCPYCDQDFSDNELNCPSCRNTIPYCITTGRHMVADDWTHCPACNFPSLYSAFVEHITSAKQCQMCKTAIHLTAITKTENVKDMLKKASLPDDDKKESKAGGSSSPHQGDRTNEDEKDLPVPPRKGAFGAFASGGALGPSAAAPQAAPSFNAAAASKWGTKDEEAESEPIGPPQGLQPGGRVTKGF